MEMEAKVTLSDKLRITEFGMEDPVYRDVTNLLWESIGQQIIEFAALREAVDEYKNIVYSINIDVKDLNNEH